MFTNIFKFSKPLAPGRSSRDNNFDFLRFALAIAVIYCHCHVLYFGTEDNVEPLWEATNRQISIGSLAVNFFFVLSGYLILQSWKKAASFGEYISKRILRIYPGFIVAGLLCLFLFAPLGTADHYQPFGYWRQFFSDVDFGWVLQNILTLQQLHLPDTLNYVPLADVLNGSLWTIRYEFYCYLFVPILQLFGVYRYKYALLAIFISSIIFLYLQDHQGITIYNWNTAPFVGKPDFFPRFLTYFLAGMCFFQYKEQIPKSKWILAISIVITSLGFFIFKGVNQVLPLFGTYILFYLAFTPIYNLRSFGKHGDFSYGLYIYAWPLQQLIVLHFEKYIDINLFFLVSVLVTFPLAWFSWKYVEQPFLNLKSRVFVSLAKLKSEMT